MRRIVGGSEVVGSVGLLVFRGLGKLKTVVGFGEIHSLILAELGQGFFHGKLSMEFETDYVGSALQATRLAHLKALHNIGTKVRVEVAVERGGGVFQAQQNLAGNDFRLLSGLRRSLGGYLQNEAPGSNWEMSSSSLLGFCFGFGNEMLTGRGERA